MLVTGTTVAIASSAHLVASGAAPGLAGLAIAMLLGSVLGLLLLGDSRLRPLRTALVVAGGQVVFHAVFSWGTFGAASSSAGHGSHGGLAPAELAMGVTHDHSSMVLAHVVAGVVSFALVMSEQRIVDAIVALTVSVARRLHPVVGAATVFVRAVAPLTRDSAHPRGRSSLPPPLRRGPPHLIAIG
jgi:hypothetical protein